MEINKKVEKYKQLLELQTKFRAGIINSESLTYEQIIMLNRLYDKQIEQLNTENEKNINKIMKYRKRLRHN